jgi:hypothetical protein
MAEERLKRSFCQWKGISSLLTEVLLQEGEKEKLTVRK